MQILGILFAVGALLTWGFGDFFIQRSTRRVGNWESLFYITAAGAIIIFPFIRSEISYVTHQPDALALLGVTAIITLFAALINLEALRRGKIAVVEPILGLELPMTVALSVALAKEHINGLAMFLIVIVFIGILLTVTTHRRHLTFHKTVFEKGVILAAVGAIVLALTNFLTGLSSRDTSPLFTIWFVHSFLAVISLIYLVALGRAKKILPNLLQFKRAVIPMAIFDNAAWIFYSYAVLFIPIAIAITISESYIALAAVLGLYFNRERLTAHQFIGVILSICGVILLSAITAV